MGLKAVFSICLVCVVGGDRLKESIYTDFDQFQACFKRLNATMEFGCTSDLSGNVGVLLYIDSQDISRVEVDDFAPYIILLSPDIFSGSMLTRLKNTGNVNGILLPGVKAGKWKGKLPAVQSDDINCPNSGSSFYTDTAEQCGGQDTTWNTAGENLLWQNWNFPIFLMNNENTTENLYSCYLEHNSGDDISWPLCAVELSSPMYAAKDSETCWRRSNIANTLTPQQYCDPLSDNNIFYFTTPRNRTLPDNSTKTQSADSVILVVARLDALNIFDKEEVGFDSPSTGIVTLISAAKAVSRELRKREYRNQVENVLFLLVHGESFDYIGSTRAVYDMMSESFPFNLTEDLKSGKMYSNGTQPLLSMENIRVIIELGQLSNRMSDDVWAHTANQGLYIEDALRVLRKTVSVKTSTGKYLPPASSQSFLKERENIPVLMLTNYNQQFSNSYYHSIYDNAVVNNYNYSLGEQQAVVQHLSSLGAAVASAVVFLATADEIVVEKDDKFVNELLHCYTETANCSLYKEASSLNGFPWTGVVQDFPFPQYISVHTSYHTLLTTQILQYSTGEIVQDTGKKDCSEDSCSEETPPNLEEEKVKCEDKNKNQRVFSYIFLIGENCYNETGPVCGSCYRTTVDRTLALSPAFEKGIIETYDWASGQYPTWTESIWKSLSGRMFLKASPASQHFTLAIGIIVLAFSFLFTFWVEKRSNVIFGTNTPQHSEYVNPVAL